MMMVSVSNRLPIVVLVGFVAAAIANDVLQLDSALDIMDDDHHDPNAFLWGLSVEDTASDTSTRDPVINNNINNNNDKVGTNDASVEPDNDDFRETVAILDASPIYQQHRDDNENNNNNNNNRQDHPQHHHQESRHPSNDTNTVMPKPQHQNNGDDDTVPVVDNHSSRLDPPPVSLPNQYQHEPQQQQQQPSSSPPSPPQQHDPSVDTKIFNKEWSQHQTVIASEPPLSDEKKEDEAEKKTESFFLPRKNTAAPMDSTQESLTRLQQVLEEFDTATTNDRRAGTIADFEDDRTLLDIFSELMKEYLTTKVIPQTNPECDWNWHSLRCEPYCDCAFAPQWGDFHLGRSCRVRTSQDLFCTSIPPRLFAEQTPLSERCVWLLQNTARGVRLRLEALAQKAISHSIQNVSNLRRAACRTGTGKTMPNLEKNQTYCWPKDELPVITFLKLIACGPATFRVCPDDEEEVSYHTQTSHAS